MTNLTSNTVYFPAVSHDDDFTAGRFEIKSLEPIHMPHVGNIEAQEIYIYVAGNSDYYPPEESKEEILNSNNGYSGITLIHINAPDIAKVKTLIEETNKSWEKGDYSEDYPGGSGDYMANIVAILELNDKSAVLIFCDVGGTYLDRSDLLEEVDKAPGFLKERGIEIIKYCHADECSGPEFFDYLQTDNYTNSKYFYDLISNDRAARNIIKERETLDSGVSTSSNSSPPTSLKV